MVDDVIFFTGINQIDIPKTSRDGERFAERFYITNDRNKIKSIIDRFRYNIGSVEYKYLAEVCPAFVYSWESISGENNPFVNFDINRSTINNITIVQLFINNLWVVKDNAIYQDRGWAFRSADSVIHNNILCSRNTTSRGSDDIVEFSHDELKFARLITKDNYVSLQTSKAPTQLVSASLRFQRFTYFVQIARAADDIAMKIANYCSALEALMSSSASELAHQIAERVAFLLEPPGATRLDRFRHIKAAYNYRSRAVHGDSFKPDQFPHLINESIYIDETCRRIAYLYMTERDGFAKQIEAKKEAYDNYFYEQIFGDKQLPK